MEKRKERNSSPYTVNRMLKLHRYIILYIDNGDRNWEVLNIEQTKNLIRSKSKRLFKIIRAKDENILFNNFTGFIAPEIKRLLKS